MTSPKPFKSASDLIKTDSDLYEYLKHPPNDKIKFKQIRERGIKTKTLFDYFQRESIDRVYYLFHDDDGDVAVYCSMKIESKSRYVLIRLPKYEVWYTNHPGPLFDELQEDLEVGVNFKPIVDLLFEDREFF